MDASFFRYLLVGAANTAIGYGVILLFQQGLHWSPLKANGVGYAVGMAVSYLLNRSFSFRSQRPHAQGVPLFLAAALACFALNVLVLTACIHWLHVPPVLAQALAIGSYTVAFFLLNKKLVFRFADRVQSRG